MKNRNLIYLVLIIILGGLVIYLASNKETNTIKRELRDFAIKDTASIDKVFMVDKENRKLLLKRQKNGEWTVNDKFPARKDAVNLLLETFHNMEVKYPVPRSAHNNVIKQLSAKSVKVEVYSGSKLLKTYYVGGPTQDHVGTYMLLENSSVPMVVYIPGFNGYLTPRFDIYEKTWREPRVFHYSYPDIHSITVRHPKEPEKSFMVINNNNTYKLIRLSDSSEVPDFDTLAVKFYIGKFKNVNYDIALTQISKHKRDSVINSTPLYIFTVEDINHHKRTIKTYLKDAPRDPNKEAVLNLPKYDIDNMYGWIPEDSLFVIVQYFVFDNLIKSVDDFIKKPDLAQNNKK